MPPAGTSAVNSLFTQPLVVFLYSAATSVAVPKASTSQVMLTQSPPVAEVKLIKIFLTESGPPAEPPSAQASELASVASSFAPVQATRLVLADPTALQSWNGPNELISMLLELNVDFNLSTNEPITSESFTGVVVEEFGLLAASEERSSPGGSLTKMYPTPLLLDFIQASIVKAVVKLSWLVKVILIWSSIPSKS